MSVTLLAGAALLITSFVRLSQQNTGFRSDHLWIGFITFPQAQYPDIATVSLSGHSMRCAQFPVSKTRR